MRKMLFPLALSAVCLAGALHLGVLHVPRLNAQEPPACSNAKCAGPSYCVWGDTFSCQFLGPDACKTERCAFILQN